MSCTVCDVRACEHNGDHVGIIYMYPCILPTSSSVRDECRETLHRIQ